MRSKREIDWEERKWQPVLDEILPVYAHFKCNLDDLVKAYQEGRVPENFYVLKRKRLEARMDKLIDQCIRNRDKRSYKISSLRQGFIDSIASQPYRFMLSISFVLPRSDDEALSDLWHLVTLISKARFGRGWGKRHDDGLIGLVIGEPHTYSEDKRGRLHFHILLREQPQLGDLFDFEQLVRSLLPHVKNKKSGRPVMHADSMDITKIHDLKGLAIYLTKSMEHSKFAKGDYIMPLHPKGIDGIGMRSLKDIWNH